MSTRIPLALCLSLALLCGAPHLATAGSEEADISARELLETERKAEEVEAHRASASPADIDAQSTPLAAMIGLRDALRAKDWKAAGAFLDRRYIGEELEGYSNELLMRAFTYVWSQQNILDLTRLSDNPEGHLDDGLPRYRDLVGTVKLLDEEIPVYLQRVPDGEGGKIWKISNATVTRIPDMWAELGYSEHAYELSRWLPEFYFLGMENWQVACVILSFLVAWPAAMLISYLMMRLALLIPNRFPGGIRRFFRRPIRFFIFILIVGGLVDQLGLSLKTRVLFGSSGIDYIAFTVVLLGLMTLMRDYQIRKMQDAGNAQYVALLRPFTTILKSIVVIVIALFWAHEAGYDMSTILAGLGVGSVAVALAAQKTLENVIGAFTLYTARPVKVGDFCRFGQVKGTVEEIGLRSTLIRTLDRSMVLIPNAVFAAQEVENFTRRERIRYFRRFQLALPEAAKLREILEQVRRLFADNPQVLDETISVRFEDIHDANAILRLDAGVDTRDYQEFLAVAEELNLGIMAIAEHAGVNFSGPGRLLLEEDAFA